MQLDSLLQMYYEACDQSMITCELWIALRKKSSKSRLVRSGFFINASFMLPRNVLQTVHVKTLIHTKFIHRRTYVAQLIMKE